MIAAAIILTLLQAPGTVLPGLGEDTLSYDMVKIPVGDQFLVQVVIRDQNGQLVESTEILLPVPEEGSKYTLELMADHANYFVAIVPVELGFLAELKENAWLFGALGTLVGAMIGAVKLFGMLRSKGKDD